MKPPLPSPSPTTLIPTAEMPPHLAEQRGKSMTTTLEELNALPLFMTTLEDNEATEALKALAYDGTPVEVAINFRERGNALFGVRKWTDARESYGKAVDVLEGERRKRRRKGEEKMHVDEHVVAAPSEQQQTVASGDKDEQHAEDGTPDDPADEDKLLETCLVNRAACQLELQNYRSCILDCAAALRLNATNVKALYRSVRALTALNRLVEADDACRRGLAIDASNAALLACAKEITRKQAALTAKERELAQLQARQALEKRVLAATLRARGIRTRRTAQPPEMEDARVHLAPDPVDVTGSRSELRFPTVLLYPLRLQSDFIKAFGERDTLRSHLEYVLPPPWEVEGGGAYASPARVEAYIETVTGGLLRVGQRVELYRVLGGGNVEVVDDVVRIFVVPKAEAAAWVADWKVKKAAEKGGAT